MKSAETPRPATVPAQGSAARPSPARSKQAASPRQKTVPVTPVGITPRGSRNLSIVLYPADAHEERPATTDGSGEEPKVANNFRRGSVRFHEKEKPCDGAGGSRPPRVAYPGGGFGYRDGAGSARRESTGTDASIVTSDGAWSDSDSNVSDSDRKPRHGPSVAFCVNSTHPPTPRRSVVGFAMAGIHPPTPPPSKSEIAAGYAASLGRTTALSKDGTWANQTDPSSKKVRSLLPSLQHQQQLIARASVQPEKRESKSAGRDAVNRQAIRNRLLSVAGGPEQAFKALDVNGSGSVSVQEFVDGMKRLHIRWKEMLGLEREVDLIKLFDRDGNGAVDLEELFPSHEKKSKQCREGMSTPELWRHWCDQSRDSEQLGRGPMWRPADTEELLNRHAEGNWVREEVASRRKWISTHYRLLKGAGRSNASCRQWIAHHLPNHHPQDRPNVEAFMRFDGSRPHNQMYLKEVQEPAQNVVSVIKDMREQRRVLSTSRRKMWAVVEEPAIRRENDLKMKDMAAEVASAMWS